MAKRTATESLQAIGTFVAAVGAIVGAIKSLPKFTDVKSLLLPQNIAWWGGTLALVAIAATLGSRALSGRSRLLRQIEIQPDRPEHLKGRAEDIEFLMELCRNEPQIHLIGESGTGKSTLVRTGLLPRLADTGFVPVYLNAWGNHWVDGPRKALIQALRATALPPDVADVLAAARRAAEMRLRLLLVFDQFDDYQNAQFARFRSEKDRTLIAPEVLAKRNEFWGAIREVIVAGDAHCLFVTRTDTAAGLDCVRFVTPRVYYLERLRAEAAFELLDTLLTADGGIQIISAAENGWPALRTRLVRDLSKEGSVLPIQMKVALRGLSSLNYLTIAEYERHGGLEGIEAEPVMWHVRNAAKRMSLNERQTLAMLTSMVDRESHKTIGRRLADLAAAAGVDEKRAASILDEWDTRALLRKRTDADTGEPTWALDHDYMSSGVLAAEARANRATRILEDAENDFRASGRSLWRRWKALLSPLQQAQLLRARLRGGFRYGRGRLFAATSLARFLPYLGAVATAAIISSNFITLTQQETVNEILRDAISSPTAEQLDRPAVDALWKLSGESASTRLAVLRSSMGSVTYAVGVDANVSSIMHAITGIDEGMRKDVLRIVHEQLSARRTGDSNEFFVRTLVDTAAELGDNDFDTLLAVGAQGRRSGDWHALDKLLESFDEKDWNSIYARNPTFRADQIARLLANLDFDAPSATAALHDALTRCNPSTLHFIVDQLGRQNQMIGARYEKLLKVLPIEMLDPNDRKRLGTFLHDLMIAGSAYDPEVWKIAKRIGKPLDPAQTHTVHAKYFSYVGVLGVPIDVPEGISLAEARKVLPKGTLSDRVTPMVIANIVRNVTDADSAALEPEFARILGQWDVDKLYDDALTPDVAKELDLQKRRDEAMSRASLYELATFTLAHIGSFSSAERKQLVALLTAKAPTAANLYNVDLAVRVVKLLGGNVDNTIAKAARARLLTSVDPQQRRDCAGFASASPALTPAERRQYSRFALEAIDADVLRRSGCIDALIALDEAVAAATLSTPSRVATFTKQMEMRGRWGSDLAEALAPIAPHLPRSLVAKMMLAVAGERGITDFLATVRAKHPEGKSICQDVEERLDETTSVKDAAALAAALAALPGTTPETMARIAAKPTCFGKCQTAVLEVAEKKSGKTFHGSIWKFVSWAKSRDVDLLAVPQRAGD